MKHLYPIALALTALAFGPVLAQSPAPARSTPTAALPQLTLSADPANNPAPAPVPVATTPSTPTPTHKVPVPADPVAAFTAGVAAYEKNDYATARELFAGAEEKAISPALEFNLGNACYQTAD